MCVIHSMQFIPSSIIVNHTSTVHNYNVLFISGAFIIPMYNLQITDQTRTTRMSQDVVLKRVTDGISSRGYIGLTCSNAFTETKTGLELRVRVRESELISFITPSQIGSS